MSPLYIDRWGPPIHIITPHGFKGILSDGLCICVLISHKLPLICCSAHRTPPIASSKFLWASQYLKRGSLLITEAILILLGIDSAHCSSYKCTSGWSKGTFSGETPPDASQGPKKLSTFFKIREDWYQTYPFLRISSPSWKGRRKSLPAGED